MFNDYGYAEESLGKVYDTRLLARLWRYVRPYGRALAAAVILVIAITALEIAMPYVTKIAIDQYIVPPPAQGDDGRTEGREDASAARWLHVSLDDPEKKEIVARYPQRFRVAQREAKILLVDLPKLDKRDVMRLRRDDLQGVAAAGAVFMGLALLSFLATFGQMMVMERAGQWIMHDLRMALYAHIQSLSVSYFNRNPVGRLVTRATNDISNMSELFNAVVVVLFKDLFLLVGLMLTMLALDWRLALICFSLMPIVAIASRWFAALAREVFRDIRVKTAEINTRFSETIGGIRVIQLFGQEATNFARFKALNHEYYLLGMRQLHIFGIFSPLIEVLAALSMALVIYYGGHGVLAERVSLGILVAFISYMRMLFRPIRDISEKYNILQNAMSSAERIFQILDIRDFEETPFVAPSEGSGRAPVHLPASEAFETEPVRDIAFEKVSLSYVKGEVVLKEIDLAVRAGETVAIVGPTGSGKTSLINLLMRFYAPSSGVIRVNGEDIRRWPMEALRKRMALVTQDPFLFSGSIRENIIQGANGNRPSDREMAAILEAANCRDIINRLPEGLDAPLSEAGASLSSGERQLVSIARAFARNPEIIMLDEATSYIDSETEARVQDALRNLIRDRTAILVAHRLSTARNADKIVVIQKGRIIESGTHDRLMAVDGYYAKLNRLGK